MPENTTERGFGLPDLPTEKLLDEDVELSEEAERDLYQALAEGRLDEGGASEGSVEQPMSAGEPSQRSSALAEQVKALLSELREQCPQLMWLVDCSSTEEGAHEALRALGVEPDLVDALEAKDGDRLLSVIEN